MRLTWDALSDRLFRTGVDHGVLYVETTDGYLPGVAWNGLTAVNDETAGHDKNFLYSGDYKSDVRFTPFEHGGTISAFFYPDEFEMCLGNIETAAGLYATGQDAFSFGLCYRSMLGDAVQSVKRGYELHIIYGAYITKYDVANETINSDGAPQPMSFTYESIPVEFTDMEPTAHIVISTLRANLNKVAAIERILYGSEEAYPRLPMPDEIYSIMYDPDDIIIPDYPEGTLHYGTIHVTDENMTVTIDGSDDATPATSAIVVEDGDRVIVLLKDGLATVMENVSKPVDPEVIRSYIELLDKPRIEGVELLGDKTYEELNLAGVTNSELERMLNS